MSDKTQIAISCAKMSLSPEHTAAPVFYTALWGQSTHQRPAELRTMDLKATWSPGHLLKILECIIA